ncbi:MAG: hypothetical protein ABFD92_07825 [Planctomycetaceae bacterium]|nr:hypothetical protein [Planctomycetaceae bacterium]
MNDFITQPIVQYGFLGFSAVLLGLVIWLIQKLLGVLEANNSIITANTEAVRDLAAMTADLLKLNRSLHDKIISRPCIARREVCDGQ